MSGLLDGGFGTHGHESPGWCPVDDVPAVREGLVGRDTVYRLVNERRIASIRLSQRRLLVRNNFLDELVREAAP